MTSTTATAPARTRSRRRRLRLGGVAVAAGVLVAATACNATMDGQTLTAIDAQEESFFSNGDEPYLAVIQFRVIPGVPGSTQVHFLGNLAEIAQNIDDGDSATIPDSMALASFPDVQLRQPAADHRRHARPRSSARSPSRWRATPARGAPSTGS